MAAHRTSVEMEIWTRTRIVLCPFPTSTALLLVSTVPFRYVSVFVCDTAYKLLTGENTFDVPAVSERIDEFRQLFCKRKLIRVNKLRKGGFNIEGRLNIVPSRFLEIAAIIAAGHMNQT